MTKHVPAIFAEVTPEEAVKRLKDLVYTAERFHMDYTANLTFNEAKTLLMLAEKGLEK